MLAACFYNHFRDSNPKKFTQGRWNQEDNLSLHYLIFKWITATFHSINLILGIVTFGIMFPDDPHKVWIFFTTWGYFVLTVAFVLDAILTLYRFYGSWFESSPELKEWNVFLTSSTILISISHPCAIMITLVFWFAIFPLTEIPDDKDSLSWYLDIATHGLQAGFVIVDVFISARPWKARHFWMPVIFGLVYVAFNAIYVVIFQGQDHNGQDFIYPILKWNENGPKSALMSFICLSALYVTYFILFGMAKIRDFMWRKWFHIPPPEPRQTQEELDIANHSFY